MRVICTRTCTLTIDGSKGPALFEKGEVYTLPDGQKFPEERFKVIADAKDDGGDDKGPSYQNYKFMLSKAGLDASGKKEELKKRFEALDKEVQKELLAGL